MPISLLRHVLFFFSFDWISGEYGLTKSNTLSHLILCVRISKCCMKNSFPIFKSSIPHEIDIWTEKSTHQLRTWYNPIFIGNKNYRDKLQYDSRNFFLVFSFVYYLCVKEYEFDAVEDVKIGLFSVEESASTECFVFSKITLCSAFSIEFCHTSHNSKAFVFHYTGLWAQLMHQMCEYMLEFALCSKCWTLWRG